MIRPFIHLALNPFLQVWLLIILGLLLRWKKKHRLSRIAFATSLVWFFLISISPLPTWFAARWEKPYASPLLTIQASSPKHIVVLGVGYSNAPTLPATGQLGTQALGRLTEAIRLYNQAPGRKICLSSSGDPDETTQAEILAQAAVELGVSPADTLINPLPNNTEAEAFTLYTRLPEVDSLILVTNALHMRRAVFWFEKAGFHVVPASTNLEVKPDPTDSPYHFWPSANKIILSRKVIHEWVGMVWAKMKTM